MNKDQFIQNVIEWANARKIIQNGSLEGQHLKFIEEAGELAAAIARNNIDGIKDAIGDMCVVEVILSKVEKRPGPPLASAGWREPNWDNVRIIQDAIEHMEVGFIDTLAYRYDFALEECWQAAWDAIKDRRGYMNEQGVFVKEEA
mgnify:FL=1